MAGLLEWAKTPEGIGLLSGIASYAANAQRGQPVNSIGRGLVGGLAGYGLAQKDIRQEQENALTQQYKQLQMDQIKQLIEDKKAQQAWKAGLPDVIAPRLLGTTGQGQQLADQQAEFGQEGLQSLQESAQYAQPDAPLNVGMGVDKQAVQQYMMQPGSPFADKLIERQFIPKEPKWTIAERFNAQTGMPEKVLMDANNPANIQSFGGQKQEPIDYNKPFLPDGSPNPAYQTYAQSKARAAAPVTRIVNNINQNTEKKFGEKFAEVAANQDLSNYDAAQKAPELAARSNRIKEAIASGKIITGFGADARLAFGKALGLVGASDSETMANTEALAADLSKNTLDAIKASGLGSGNGFSNADRDFLEKSAGGKINLEGKTLSRLADLAYRAAQLSTQKWNKRVASIPQSALEGTGITRDPILVPPLFGKDPENKAIIHPQFPGFSIVK